MTEYPVTSTPSRAAGQPLQRAAEPENSCADEPVAPEDSDARTRRVEALTLDGHDSKKVEVPSDPDRILSLGVGAVDAACLLGLQHQVVASSPIPDASTWLPEPLTTVPEVDPTSADDIERAVEEFRPDLILVPASVTHDSEIRDTLSSEQSEVPIVVYQDDPTLWDDAVTVLTDALGRPKAGKDALLDFIGQVRITQGKTTPHDTEVSVIDLAGGNPNAVRVLDASTLGVTLLHTVGARRPPAQVVRDDDADESVDTISRPVDEFSGDVVLGVLEQCPDCEERTRELLGTDRWQSLPPLKQDRFFLVDASVWQHGDGLVAARAVLEDIEDTINASGGVG